ncbi:MAG: hypothetical protein JNL10_17955 [Verrucomicrobiales bacterium]|nr:hypothetical protein [Verrucomicrobiales bacterium]
MKQTSPFSSVVLLALLSSMRIAADISIPGISGTPVAGIDGNFAPTSPTTIIDLSTSLIGAWDSAPASGTTGVYDPEKWGVVFKYSSVNIPAGVTIKFRNNATRAPVVWLVTGDVTISGNINLYGEDGSIRQFPEPGPGGFRGGSHFTPVGSGGMGPGGGNRGQNPIGGSSTPGGGSYRTNASANSGPSYGDPEITQLLGGSGGGSHRESTRGGGAGGGAILIVATGRIHLGGSIDAFGGTSSIYGGGGSGGSIRLVASELTGTGFINVLGGGSGDLAGSPGFIRAEAEVFGANSVSAYPPGISSEVISGPARIWPEETGPRARILSVSNLPIPPDPRSDLGLAPTDVNVPFNGSREVRIETRNFPTTGTVTLFVTPAQGDRTSLKPALLPGGTSALATWQATLDSALSGRVALQVRAAAE